MRRLPLLLLVLAACGDDSARRISDAPAGPHDSPPLIDTPAQALPVLVSVTFPDGTPVPDVKVYFQHADSRVAGEAPPDANGNARQVMNPGGYATAVVPNVLIAGFGGVASMQYSVASCTGVKPGDHLILTPPAGGGSIQTTITIPLDTLHAGVTQYLVEGTCTGGPEYIPPPSGSGATNVSATLYFNNGCPAADMFVAALDANYNPISSFSVPAQPVTSGATIDYSAQTYALATTRTFTFNNFTAGFTIGVSDHVVTGRGDLYQGNAVSASAEHPAAATVTVTAPVAGSLDVVRAEQSSSNTYRNFIEWGTTGAYTTDWSADLLPDFATAPSLDTGTHIISWTTTGGTLTPDFSAATVLANRQLPTPIQWQWGIVAPSGTQLAYPTLPTDIADLNVGADDDYNLFGTPVRIAKVPGGYDAARGAFFSTFEPIPTGATATAAWNDYQQPLTVAAKQKPAKSGVMRRWIRPR